MAPRPFYPQLLRNKYILKTKMLYGQNKNADQPPSVNSYPHGGSPDNHKIPVKIVLVTAYRRLLKTAGKTWKELEKAAMEREQWKSLVAALCAS